MLRKIYLTLGVLIIAVYGWVAFSGWEPGTAGRQKIPPGARTGTGYRSHYFWHSGYRGGK
jgi:hypothetical protein